MVDVRFHPRERDTAEALGEHITSVLGVGTVVSGRLCPACGSDRHGAPWARIGGQPVAVSLSRSGPHLVTAVAENGRIGVDIESVDAVARGWDPDLVLAPGEQADDHFGRARAWAAKEAVLKALGIGLARPMTSIVVADHHVIDVPAEAGYVAVIAVL